jgi:hypothetical protein
MSILYLPILPVGVVISLGGIILFYFVEKWNITQRYKKPPSVDSGITFGYLFSFRLFLFVYSISVYVFLRDTYPYYFDFALFSIILYGIITLIPYARLFQCDLLKVVTVDDYEEEYFKFTTKYETQNPITKSKASHKLLGKLKEKGIVTDEEYSDYARRLGEGEFIDLLELYRDRTGKQSFVQLNSLVHQAFNSRSLDKNTTHKQRDTSNSIKKALINKTGKSGYFDQNQQGIKLYNNNEKYPTNLNENVELNDHKEDLLNIRS